MNYMAKRSVAVSIIGGADGPTSIFLAGKVGDGFFGGKCIVGIIVVSFIIGVCIFIKRINKK